MPQHCSEWCQRLISRQNLYSSERFGQAKIFLVDARFDPLLPVLLLLLLDLPQRHIPRMYTHQLKEAAIP